MTIPTYNELYTSILSDLRNKLGLNFIVGRLVLIAFASVQAAKLKLIYLVAAFIYKNIFPDTADSETLGGTLERFGLVKLGRLPFDAIAGQYTIEVAGEIGATIQPNTTFKSLDTSASPDKLFICENLFTFTGLTGEITIVALEAGVSSRLEVGDQLQVTAPIALVNSFATVLSVDVEAVEAENIEEYRLKVIQAYRSEPQGGARIDYILWASDAAGVRTIYPYVTNGAPGELDIFVEANPADSVDGFGTPTPTILSDVADVIELDPDTIKPMAERGRRPLGIFNINYYPITLLPLDVQIVDLSDVSYLTAIESAITDYIFNIRPYIAGATDPNSINDKIYISDIFNIVISVIGKTITFSEIIMEIDDNIVNLYQFTNGEIPYCRNVV
jgi:hypothetical protein